VSEEAPRRRGGLLARVAFLLLLAGGLALWADLRRPRELRVDLDLTEALPGDVVEVDVTVSREGRALARRPGRADVDATLIDGQGRARHTQTVVELRKDRAAAVKVR